MSVADQQLAHLVLPDVEVVGVLQHLSPGPDELPSVALRTRAPHGRPLAAVEHAELNGGLVSHLTCVSAQRIYLAYNLPLGNPAYGRVAAHLRYLVHVHGDQARLRAHPGTRTCRFAARMTATHDHHIVSHFHFHPHSCLYVISLFRTQK